MNSFNFLAGPDTQVGPLFIVKFGPSRLSFSD